MNKKFLICLLAIIMCLTLAGCGKEEKLDSSLNDTSNSNQSNETTNNNNTSENITIDDDEIIDFGGDDNKPTEDENIVIEKVINCGGCVYAYFSSEKTFGSTLSEGEYTTDVSKLKTSGGKQRHNFFGFVLSNNKISRAYSCILKDNKIYCLEGTSEGQQHNSNITVLNQIFTSGQCKTIADGHTYTCTDGNYNGDTQSNGYASMHYETSCVIIGQTNNKIKMSCN